MAFLSILPTWRIGVCSRIAPQRVIGVGKRKLHTQVFQVNAHCWVHRIQLQSHCRRQLLVSMQQDIGGEGGEVKIFIKMTY